MRLHNVHKYKETPALKKREGENHEIVNESCDGGIVCIGSVQWFRA
jgi:hypothetical protein